MISDGLLTTIEPKDGEAHRLLIEDPRVRAALGAFLFASRDSPESNVHVGLLRELSIASFLVGCRGGADETAPGKEALWQNIQAYASAFASGPDEDRKVQRDYLLQQLDRLYAVCRPAGGA